MLRPDLKLELVLKTGRLFYNWSTGFKTGQPDL